MEGFEVEGPASATHTGPPESHDLDLDYSSPVGSPDHEHHHHDVLPEIHALPSDDDHDPDPDHGPEHEHEQEQEQVQGPPGGPAVLTDDLKHKIIKQAR
ncbi:hypothetical protein CFP56_021199 [Quercus suber]|uniref:Uncharacterized protein n=1 Tax=Quercus suber TaxID=58331 RepID=A0AAW0KG89_QUESU